MSFSVIVSMNAGQIPPMSRHIDMSDNGMMMLAKGRVSRLVRRKCLAKVPKYIYTNGPVVIWHAIDIEAEFHIHRKGPRSLSGHSPFSQGNKYAIPVIAAYDSWKPML